MRATGILSIIVRMTFIGTNVSGTMRSIVLA
jgi:hypothetical protein